MLTIKSLKIVLLLISMMMLATGCWDSIDINEKDIVTAVVVDKTDSGYAFYVEIPPIAASSNQNGSTSQTAKDSILRSEGKTFIEAREDLDRVADKPIFLGAVQSVILTDRLASYNIEEYMQRLRQINDYRKTVDVIITTEDPEKLLNDTTENSTSAGFSIHDTLESLDNTGQLYEITLSDIYETLDSSYKHYALPTIALEKNDPALTGFTVFSGGIKTGFIPISECNSIIYMNSKKAKFSYVVPYRDTYITAEVRLAKKQIKPNYTNGQVSFKINLSFSAEVTYTERNIKIGDDAKAEIRAMLQAMLEKEFREAFAKSQQTYQFDCFGLNEVFRINNPELYKKMNWAQEYQKLSADISIAVATRTFDSMDYNP